MKKTSLFLAAIAFVVFVSVSCCGGSQKSDKKACQTECSAQTKSEKSCCPADKENCQEKADCPIDKETCPQKTENSCCAAE